MMQNCFTCGTFIDLELVRMKLEKTNESPENSCV